MAYLWDWWKAKTFDYRSEIREALSTGRTLDAKRSIVEVVSILDEVGNQAAVLDNREVVNVLLQYTRFLCSGFLMEDLVNKGLMDMAKLFVDNNRVWGSARERYEEATQRPLPK